MNDPQDTTYGSDADLLEEKGNVWKARAEKAEAEVAAWRRATGRDDAETLDFELGRAGIDVHLRVLEGQRDEWRKRAEGLGAENERLSLEVDGLDIEAQFQRESADRAAKSFLTAQGERDAARSEVAAAVLREREECLGALLALERRRNPGELVTLQDGIDAIRARSK